MNDRCIVPCPPLSVFPKPLEDQSESHAKECPICKELMWMTVKKKKLIKQFKKLKKEVLIGCYKCIKNSIEENAHTFRKSKIYNINIE